MFLRTLPVGFMASLLTAALLLSMSDLAIAQRSGVRSGVIGSAPTDSARSGVIGGGYRGAPIGRRERRGWAYPYILIRLPAHGRRVRFLNLSQSGERRSCVN
jgi:hypothetical protein